MIVQTCKSITSEEIRNRQTYIIIVIHTEDSSQEFYSIKCQLHTLNILNILNQQATFRDTTRTRKATDHQWRDVLITSIIAFI